VQRCLFSLHHRLDVVGLKLSVDSVYKNEVQAVAKAAVIVAHYRGASLALK
jgi:hypothetical protein